MRFFVIPDTHGRHDLLKQLLMDAGVPLLPTDRAAAGIHTVQLGDLANCVEDSVADDRTILLGALVWLDTVLVGNHEWPYFGGDRFNGFHPDADVASGIYRLKSAGVLRSHLEIGETLLTHAGVSPHWGIETAREAAHLIRQAWTSDPTADKLFSRIGPARMGLYESHAAALGMPLHGGILWSDWSEGRAPFRQIHGHTPHLDGPKRIGETVDLDVGCGKYGDRLAGLWVDEDGSFDLDALVQVKDEQLVA